jgi:hypothetical protein
MTCWWLDKDLEMTVRSSAKPLTLCLDDEKDFDSCTCSLTFLRGREGGVTSLGRYFLALFLAKYHAWG